MRVTIYRFVDKPKGNFERQIDPTLKTTIEQDVRYRQAFFSILLDLLFEWIDNGCPTPELAPRFKKDTKEFFEDIDPVQMFLTEFTKKSGNPDHKVTLEELYKKYCSEIEGDIMSNIKFANQLRSKGFRIDKSGGSRYVFNIRIVEKPKQTVQV